jgi:hypothetical protein
MRIGLCATVTENDGAKRQISLCIEPVEIAVCLLELRSSISASIDRAKASSSPSLAADDDFRKGVGLTKGLK